MTRELTITSGRRLMFGGLINSLLLLSCLHGIAGPLIEAADLTAVPANQLTVAGNACGPAALLNAYRFGSKNWQRAAEGLAGENDKEQITTIIRSYGMRPSLHLNNRTRWSRKGVNLADLTDIANETARTHLLPLVSQEVLFRKSGENPEELLKRTHGYFATSLEKGLPPLLSLRRYVLRKGDWTILDAHFVTLISVPKKLEKGSTSFEIAYIDPWGGKIRNGTIGIPSRPVLAGEVAESPCLEANMPTALVGKKLLRAGEVSTLTLAGVIGRW